MDADDAHMEEDEEKSDEEMNDDDDDEEGGAEDDEEDDGYGSFSEQWSFYECVIHGSVKGVERYISQDPTIVHEPFRLSVIYDENASGSLGCYCWQYFEVGFQVDHLAGFYPGTLSWHSRVYPPSEASGSGRSSMDGDGGDSPATLNNQIVSRLTTFFLSLKKKDFSRPSTSIRVCQCRREDSLRLLLDSASHCRDHVELDLLLDDSRTMNKLAVTYPLHLAAILGRRRVLKALLKHGANKDLKTRACGLQAIHLAVMYRRRACLQTLVDAGADVNSYGFYTTYDCPVKGQIPFEWRILPISQAIELTLESYHRASQGSSFDFKRKTYDELLDWHCFVQCNEDAEMIEAILRAPSGCDVNKLDGPPEESTYPLLRAIQGGRALVERLLVAGADASVVDWGMESTLTAALTEQDLELMKMLMFYGADPNHVGESDDTVLHILAQTPMAIGDLNYNMMKYFLDNGANPNVTNNYGETPLMDAINSEHITVETSVACDLLLSYPVVDVTMCRREDHYQPLHSAAWNNLRGIVETMLKKGADPCALTLDKNTPLGIAAFRQNREAVYLLAPLNRHLIDNADKDGDRAIHYAAYQGDVDMVNCLLDQGADPDVANDHGVTPVWYACYFGHTATLVQLLRFQMHVLNKKSRGTVQIANGYNSVNFIYAEAKSPLYAACERGYFEVAQILLDRGYPVNQEHSWILLDPPQKLNENDVFRRHLLSLSSNPPTLRSRIMSWFRTSYGGDLPLVTRHVRLPTDLKRELINRDLPHRGNEYAVRNFNERMNEYCLT